MAVSVTTVPSSYTPPAGLRATLPAPTPDVVTVRVCCTGGGVSTVMVLTALPVAPSLSVTVNVAVYVPADV